jgi:hypothetical protein
VLRRVTTQDISWFIDLENNKQLELNPPYQRKSVWSSKDRKFFLDTIFRGYPSPSIFLSKSLKENKTIYHVVDGKQRLETIINFVNNRIAIDKNYGDVRLAGKKWKDLEKEGAEDLKQKFWDYVLPVEFINVDQTGTFVNEVFERLNRNSRKLVEQELRHAKYDGWLITYIEEEAESIGWKKLGISTTARAKRMKDIQFISELLMINLKKEVSGFDQGKIDEMYAFYEDPFEENFSVEFNEEEIRNNFELVKSFLLDCEDKGEVVTRFAKDFKNFYSLWGVVALNLNRLPSVDDFIEKYSPFMEMVEKYKEISFLEENRENPEFEKSYTYYLANIGANTEEPQRNTRNKILNSIIFGDEWSNENTTDA